MMNFQSKKSGSVSKDRMIAKFMQEFKPPPSLQLTATGEKTANFCLSVHGWKLDQACDYYFSNPEKYARDHKHQILVDRKKIQHLFDRYRDPSLDVISVDPNHDGLLRFFQVGAYFI
eukprot:sb/3476525/